MESAVAQAGADRRGLHLAVAASLLLASGRAAASVAGALPAAGGLAVAVSAAPNTTYLAKCHIRSFRDDLGIVGNTYVINSKGAFHDIIPSPNAQCVFGKLKGDGPATLHIYKNGDHSAEVEVPGRWVRLEVW